MEVDPELLRMARVMAKWFYRRVGRHVTLEDLTSDAEYGLAVALGTFDAGRGASLRTWASRCIKREIIEALRASAKHSCCESLGDREQVDLSIDTRVLEEIRWAVGQLGHTQRRLIEMYYFDGEDYRDICSALGLASPSNFTYYKRQALKRLRRLLSGAGPFVLDSVAGFKPPVLAFIKREESLAAA
jgi:RNA polymerase sigma factor (sigma-70 family)